MSRGRVVRIRKINSTALIYCEGTHDHAFLRYLISVYSKNRQLKTKFRLKKGNGGSPDTLLMETVNVPGAFDRRLLKADKDRAIEEIRRVEEMSTQHKVEVIWSEPCIEALLMSILDGKDYSGWKSKTCKRVFESKYVPPNKRTKPRAYSKDYPVKVIEDARKRLPELDQLILFITS